jgi:membrane protein implicated in regulation of membrane protease activity
MKWILRRLISWWLDFDPDDPESYPATGSPELAEGDRVVVIDEDLHEAFETATGTVVEVNDQFGQWEYRVEMDGSDSWLIQRNPDLERGWWMGGEQLERIVE